MGFIDRQSILIEEIIASYLFMLKITMLTDIIYNMEINIDIKQYIFNLLFIIFPSFSFS